MSVYDSALENFKQEFEFRRLFDGDGILAVNKPPSVISHSSRKYPIGIEEVVTEQMGRTYHACNRLDMPTSGVMLLAKSKDIRSHLHSDWKNLTQKYYLAVVHRLADDYQGTFDVKTQLVINKRVTITSNMTMGVKSKSRFTRIADFGDYTLLMVELITGKKHQIRVHCASVLGSSIVGDQLYKTNGYEKLLSWRSILLHSWITHVDLTGIGGSTHRVVAPIPSYYMEFMNKNGLNWTESEIAREAGL